ncbi:MAG: diacylglycerol kinase family lipid kinase [Bacteroidales bacterium]|nr:diacylglycerol kinase family lipid kinase [Bacteroidales bacterium]
MGKSAQNGEWRVIVNPNAGRRKGKKDWHLISDLLNRYEIPFSHIFTEAKHHAIKLAMDALEKGKRKILVVGGDGTMNEVVNGAFLQNIVPTTDITLGMLTVGTGNDWGRMFNIPVDYESAIRVIKNEDTFLQDTGIIKFYSGTDVRKRYFINIAGLGFDALVVQRSNRQKERGRSSKTLYFWTLLRSLMSYKHTRTCIEIDGMKIQNDTFTISLGIGKYSGGGMMQTPGAIADDGLFELTLIKRMRKGEIIRSLKRLYNGTILDHPKVEGYTGKQIKIDSDPLIHVEADGESLGHSPIEFNILPRSIKIVRGISGA